MADAGFAVTHLYGLTETYGPAVVNEWHGEWDGLDKSQRAATQGAAGRALCRAGGPDRDGPRNDAEDAGRWRDDRRGHVPRQHRHEGLSEEQVRDRRGACRRLVPFRRPRRHASRTATSSSRTAPRTSSSPAARTSPRSRSRTRSTSTRPSPPAAWWRRPDEKWGEVPVAYVELKPGASGRPRPRSSTTAARCLPASRCPKAVIFAEIPKTSTGKIQKFRLREMARTG